MALTIVADFPRAPEAVGRQTLTKPMTEEQHRQAVSALSAMIGDWLRKQASEAAGDRRVGRTVGR